MTNKQRAIEAFKELQYKYEHPEGQIFRNIKTCPLCKIFYYNNLYCIPCPQASQTPSHGCLRFYTLCIIPKKEYVNMADANEFCYSFYKQRAIFFKRAIPLLEKLPEKAFTKKGWKLKYFSFLDEIDEDLMNNPIDQF